MLAKDIMTKDVITVRPEEKVENVARMLVESKISGIPVVDENHIVLGVVSEQDLIVKAGDLRVPFYLTLFDSIIFLENPIRFNNDLKKFIAIKVKDVMTTKVIAVEEDYEVSTIVDLMHKHRINRVPVLRHGKLIGIVTRNDILKALVKSNG